MSTPFPPKSGQRGISAYVPPRVRDRVLSNDPRESPGTPAPTEAAKPDAEWTDQAPTPEDARAANEAGAPTDPLDWLDEAIRAVVELKRSSDDGAELPAAAPNSPYIPPPTRTATVERPQSSAPRHDRAEARYQQPRLPRLETQIVPPPPAPTREGGWLGQMVRMSLAIAFAAIAAYGITRIYPSGLSTPQLIDRSRRAETLTIPQTLSRLIVENQQAFTNEPISLAVNVDEARRNESLLLDGLVQGTTLSAGTSATRSSWQLSPDKLAGLYLYAPKDFVGVMDTTVKLLNRDKRVLDSRGMQLKWISRPAQQPSARAVASAREEAPLGVRTDSTSSPARTVKPIDPGEAEMLMQRGRDFLATGDISAARVAFQRLADAGISDAALALAKTYDPSYLASHNVVGVQGDSAMARTLYKRAKELGSAEADRSLAHAN